jgi:competence protein ComGC
MKTANQRGFSIVELLIIVAVVSLLGFVAYTFTGRNADLADKGDGTSTAVVRPEDVPDVDSTKDLDEADTMLNQVSLDEDTSSIDSDVSEF